MSRGHGYANGNNHIYYRSNIFPGISIRMPSYHLTILPSNCIPGMTTTLQHITEYLLLDKESELSAVSDYPSLYALIRT